MILLTSFPALLGPGPPNHNIQQAFHIISESFNNSLQLLQQNNHDILHIHFHMNCLEHHICHLYHALSSKEIPQDWFETGAHHLGQLLAALWTAMLGADKQLVSNLYFTITHFIHSS